jgi:hypothetical protein
MHHPAHLHANRFIAAFIRSPNARFTALVLATVGGGLGWIVTFTGTLPPDFYIPEGFGFLIIFGLPHLALARAALLGGLLLLFKSLEPQRQESHEGGSVGARHPVPLHSILLPFLAALCWLIVGLAVPFYLDILYCILGAWGLAT